MLMNMIRNKVQLIGHVGITPEIKSFENGKVLSRFSLATKDNYKDKNGVWQSNTEWHTITAWGKTAELVQKIIAKGDEVAVEGKLVSRSFEDKEGQTRKTTEISMNEVLVLKKRD